MAREPYSPNSAPQLERDANSDAASAEYHLLDMGSEKYGDSILYRLGDKTILIDAGHPSDFDGQDGYDSIPDQLAEILGRRPPFNLTLLVVTHAHNDHIGCLPKMIEAGMIKPQFALVADPDLGFPPGYRDAIDGVDHLDAATAEAVQRAVAAAAEEDYSSLPDAELDAFLDLAAKLGGRYRDMLDKLEEGGTRIFKWGTSDPTELQPIYRALAGTGFDIIGPSRPHLEICRDQIIAYARRARDTLLSAIADIRTTGRDAPISATALYRAAIQPRTASDILIDRRGQGSAINCQSIVLTFGAGDQKVLLAADMQFAAPEVSGLSREMADLRRKVVDAGPYRFVKTTHHTSENGLDTDLWSDLGKPPLLAHSGGLYDVDHPDAGALRALRELAREIIFARTDRNGQIAVDPRRSDRSAFTISRGRLNDFTLNRGRPRDLAKPQPTNVLQVEGAGTPAAPPGSASFVDIVMVRIPYEDGRVSIDGRAIEISGRGRGEGSGGRQQQLRPTPTPDPERRPPQPGANKLGGGRDMSKLLFVTHAKKLEKNLGELEAGRALRMISEGAQCIKIDGMERPEQAVRRELAKGKHKGVVIVGGYDVVPPQRVDVLDAALRASIPRENIEEDQDEFVVWSDDTWGDIDGENMPDVPVSRIPDARVPALVFKALQANVPQAAGGRFGIRNMVRPFATRIFNTVPGSEPLMTCAPTRYDQIPPGAVQRPFLYFMLHGLDRDCSRFWGDNPGRGVVEAINTASLPKQGLSVALAGCCWGALTVEQRANDRSGILSPKPPEGSMALSILMGGALAYIGCTGVHYSPDAGGGFFGGPMHLAFWEEYVGNRRSPAEALFEARRKFLADMPHGRVLPLEIGIERKIYKQFTCLGLGW